MSKTVDFLANKTALTDRGISPAIWGTCPIQDIRAGKIDGWFIEDDFVDLPLAPTLTTQIAFGKYKAFATSGETISGVSSVNSTDTPGGILQMTVGTSGNSASIAGAYRAFRMSGNTTTDGPLWFEARVAVSSILTLRAGLFVGLAETAGFTLATGVPFSSNAGNPTSGGSLFGFQRLGAGTSTLSSAYTDRATSFTAVGSAEVTGLTAYGFTKLGIFYDPAARDATRMVRFFQDNAELSSAMSKTTLQALTNGDANSLNVMAAVVGGSSVSSDALFIDWWKCYQCAGPL